MKNIFGLKSRSKYTARSLYEYQIKLIYQRTKIKTPEHLEWFTEEFFSKVF